MVKEISALDLILHSHHVHPVPFFRGAFTSSIETRTRILYLWPIENYHFRQYHIFVINLAVELDVVVRNLEPNFVSLLSTVHSSSTVIKCRKGAL